MRLVLSGYYGCGNTGDEAILAGMLADMRAIDPAIEAVVVSGDPAETRRTHGVEAVPRMRPMALFRALRTSDGLVSGGGGLLQDRTSARPVAYYAGVMGLARTARRPYAIHAQGLGPISRAFNRRIAAAALRGATRITLRDDASRRLARELGIRRPIGLVPDPALAIEPARGDGAGHLLVAVRGWGASAGHLASIRAALAQLAGELRIVALPMHEPVDRPAALEVIAGLPRATVTSPELGLEERIAAIGSASLVIGMRLHALVLAAAAGVPAVAISYDPKVDAFASQMQVPIAGNLDAGLDANEIVETSRRALSSPSADRQRLVESMRAKARKGTADLLEAIGSARGG